MRKTRNRGERNRMQRRTSTSSAGGGSLDDDDDDAVPPMPTNSAVWTMPPPVVAGPSSYAAAPPPPNEAYAYHDTSSGTVLMPPQPVYHNGGAPVTLEPEHRRLHHYSSQSSLHAMSEPSSHDRATPPQQIVFQPVDWHPDPRTPYQQGHYLAPGVDVKPNMARRASDLGPAPTTPPTVRMRRASQMPPQLDHAPESSHNVQLATQLSPQYHLPSGTPQGKGVADWQERYRAITERNHSMSYPHHMYDARTGSPHHQEMAPASMRLTDHSDVAVSGLTMPMPSHVDALGQPQFIHASMGGPSADATPKLGSDFAHVPSHAYDATSLAAQPEQQRYFAANSAPMPPSPSGSSWSSITPEDTPMRPYIELPPPHADHQHRQQPLSHEQQQQHHHQQPYQFVSPHAYTTSIPAAPTHAPTAAELYHEPPHHFENGLAMHHRASVSAPYYAPEHSDATVRRATGDGLA